MARKDSPDDPQPLAGKEAASRANRSLDAALRPPKLDDFVGQQRTVERLRSLGADIERLPASAMPKGFAED